MYPVIFNWGPFTIHTYGLLVAVGFWIALQLTSQLAVRSRLPIQKILDLNFWCLLVGCIGARSLFILTQLDFFYQHPLEIFKIWNGGLVFFGFLLTSVAFIVFYTKKTALPLWKTLDVFTPGLVIAHAIGRLGCFGTGCCYGKPTEHFFGVKFYSELVERKYWGVPLHPTQLYEAFSLLILFFALWKLFPKKRFDGQVILTYCLAYPLLRIFIECFRGDSVRGFVLGTPFSTSQWISGGIFLGACFILWRKSIHPQHHQKSFLKKRKGIPAC